MVWRHKLYAVTVVSIAAAVLSLPVQAQTLEDPTQTLTQDASAYAEDVSEAVTENQEQAGTYTGVNIAYSDVKNVNTSVSYDWDKTIAFQNGIDKYQVVVYNVTTEQEGVITIDFTGRMYGYMKPGTYAVEGFRYEGSNQEMMRAPCAMESPFVINNSSMAMLHFRFGAYSVNDLKNQVQEVFSVDHPEYGLETNVRQAFEEINMAEGGSSPFVDVRIFGQNEEAKQRYYQNMQAQGYMDDHANLTEKGKQLKESLEAYEREQAQEVLPNKYALDEEDEIDPAYYSYIGSPAPGAYENGQGMSGENYEGLYGDTGQNVTGGETGAIEHRLDQEEQTESQKKTSAVTSFLWSNLIYIIALVVIIIVYLVYKAKNKA